MEQKSVNVGKYCVVIHELTTEDESRIRADSQKFDSKEKTWKLDRALLDALYIKYSVSASTWPKEWGPLEADNIKNMPAKLTRKIYVECNRLNTLSDDAEGFLESRPQSPAPTTGTTTS